MQLADSMSRETANNTSMGTWPPFLHCSCIYYVHVLTNKPIKLFIAYLVAWVNWTSLMQAFIAIFSNSSSLIYFLLLVYFHSPFPIFFTSHSLFFYIINLIILSIFFNQPLTFHRSVYILIVLIIFFYISILKKHNIMYKLETRPSFVWVYILFQEESWNTLSIKKIRSLKI